MLFLVVHSLEAATASVPLCVVMLQDHIKRRSIPPQFKLRMILPSAGVHSVSVWDSDDAAELKAWIEDNVGQDCQVDVAEIKEDFTYGVTFELTRARAAEKVAAGSKNTLEQLNESTQKAAAVVGSTTAKAVDALHQGLEQLDSRTGIFSATRNTATVASQRFKAMQERTISTDRVNTVVTNVGAGATAAWKRVGFGLTWVGERVNKMTDNVVRSVSGTESQGGVWAAQSGQSVVDKAVDGEHLKEHVFVGSEEDLLNLMQRLGLEIDMDDDLEDVCPTCLEPFTEDNPRIRTSCNHHFHMQCICSWLDGYGSTCPTCLTPLSVEDALAGGNTDAPGSSFDAPAAIAGTADVPSQESLPVEQSQTGVVAAPASS